MDATQAFLSKEAGEREYQIFTNFEKPETYNEDAMEKIVNDLEKQDKYAKNSIL